MEVRRTVPVKLDVDSDDTALLEDTVDTFLWCAQYVTAHAFEGEYVTTSKTTLDDETYDDVREVTDGCMNMSSIRLQSTASTWSK